MTRVQLAHHEAAHAIACLHFGVPIREARLRPDGSGVVWHHTIADPFEDAIVGYCGHEAEKRLARGGEPDWVPSISDHATARKRLEAKIPDARERFAALKRVERQARHLVIVNWPLIVRIARHLERDSVLSGAAIRRVLQQHVEEQQR